MELEAENEPKLRPMLAADLPACYALSRQADWPHRLADWNFAFGLGSGFVAAVDQHIVGTAMLWPQGESHGSVGLIIVAPEHQGVGLGKRLMQALLEAAEGRSLFLNATPQGQPLYALHGFSVHGGLFQHQGIMPSVASPQAPSGTRLRPATPADLPKLTTLDAEATGLARAPILLALLGAGAGVVLETGAGIAGFAVLRESGRGRTIGPVVAQNEADARLLVGHWLAAHPGAFLRIDLSQDGGLGDWLAGLGLPCVASAPTMVRGQPPAAPGPARRFALVSQAIG